VSFFLNTLFVSALLALASATFCVASTRLTRAITHHPLSPTPTKENNDKYYSISKKRYRCRSHLYHFHHQFCHLPPPLHLDNDDSNDGFINDDRVFTVPIAQEVNYPDNDGNNRSGEPIVEAVRDRCGCWEKCDSVQQD